MDSGLGRAWRAQGSSHTHGHCVCAASEGWEGNPSPAPGFRETDEVQHPSCCAKKLILMICDQKGTLLLLIFCHIDPAAFWVLGIFYFCSTTWAGPSCALAEILQTRMAGLETVFSEVNNGLISRVRNFLKGLRVKKKLSIHTSDLISTDWVVFTAHSTPSTDINMCRHLRWDLSKAPTCKPK